MLDSFRVLTKWSGVSAPVAAAHTGKRYTGYSSTRAKCRSALCMAAQDRGALCIAQERVALCYASQGYSSTRETSVPRTG